MNPLTPNLRELTDDVIQERINELYIRLGTAGRMGHQNLYAQVLNMLNEYREEHSRRLAEAWDKNKSNKYFKDKINVKKKHT